MLALIDRLFPYVLAFVVGCSLGMWLKGMEDDRVLARTKQGYAQELQRISAAAALADEKAIADHRAQEGKIATLDAQLTQEKQAHEDDAHRYADALAAGTQRLRIAVTSCTRTHDVPATSPAASVDDGPAAVADIDPETASGLVRYAADDQREIDKLKGLQAYVCSIRPDLAGCSAR